MNPAAPPNGSSTGQHPFPLGHAVSELAWADLGVPPCDIWAPEAHDLHPILLEFRQRCQKGIEANATPLRSVRERIDRSKKRAQADPRKYHELRDVDVYRIRADTKAGDAYRAAVWHDDRANVVWLLRVKRISDYGGQAAEDALYEDLGELHENGSLLPTEAETSAALNRQYLEAVIDALILARKAAEEDLEVWKTAVVKVGENPVPVGDVHVHAERDPSGVYVWTIALVVMDDPVPFQRPPLWREAIKARVFEGEEMVEEDWAMLPSTRPRRGQVIPFQQARIIDDS